MSEDTLFTGDESSKMVRMDPELHALAKVVAAARRQTLQDFVAAAVRAEIERDSMPSEPVREADTPESAAEKAKLARATLEKAAEAMSGWSPRGLSKAEQATKGRKKP